MGNDFATHVDFITKTIEDDGHVYEPVFEAQEKAKNLLKNGTKISKIDVLAFPELFDIRIRANRRVIDLEHFHPTKMEMDEALEIVAENILDDVIASADISEPNFND